MKTIRAIVKLEVVREGSSFKKSPHNYELSRILQVSQVIKCYACIRLPYNLIYKEPFSPGQDEPQASGNISLFLQVHEYEPGHRS